MEALGSLQHKQFKQIIKIILHVYFFFGFVFLSIILSSSGPVPFDIIVIVNKKKENHSKRGKKLLNKFQKYIFWNGFLSEKLFLEKRGSHVFEINYFSFFCDNPVIY